MANPVRCSPEKIRSLVITNLDAAIVAETWKFLSTPGRLVFVPNAIANLADGVVFDAVDDILAATKKTDAAWTPPVLVYYDYGNALFTTTSGITSSVKAGICLEAASQSATSGRIRFDQPL